MKKFIIALVFYYSLFITQYSLSQSSWFPLNSGTSIMLNKIQFVNSQIGWACGYQSIPTQYTLIKTTNGGVSWSNQISNLPFGNRFMSLYFTDAYTGYVCGAEGIFKTTNGGNNYFTASSTAIVVYDCFFINANTGWIAWADTAARVAKTTNGGINWTPQGSGLNSSEQIYCIYFANSNKGWCTGYNSIYKTTNGGASWIVQPHQQVSSIGKIIAVSPDSVLIAANESVLTTSNGGVNWTVRIVQTFKINKGIYFLDFNTGYVSTTSGSVYKTTNNGLNWTMQIGDSAQSLNSIYFTSPDTGYVCGTAGRIYKTVNGGTIGIKKNGNEIPERFALEQNYPNPFNPTTNIRYQIANNKLVTVKIYNILGNEVAVLVNEKQSPGVYEISWDASTFPGGVYFCKLEAGGFSEVKKMLLIK